MFLHDIAILGRFLRSVNCSPPPFRECSLVPRDEFIELGVENESRRRICVRPNGATDQLHESPRRLQLIPRPISSAARPCIGVQPRIRNLADYLESGEIFLEVNALCQ